MKLRLIGPEDEYEYDYWQDDKPPAVVTTEDRTWVRGSNSTVDNHMYFEQLGLAWVYPDALRKVK